MNSNRKKTDLKGRDFNGTYYPKLKGVRQEPRRKIRQFLRSRRPSNAPASEAHTGQKSLP